MDLEPGEYEIVKYWFIPKTYNYAEKLSVMIDNNGLPDFLWFKLNKIEVGFGDRDVLVVEEEIEEPEPQEPRSGLGALFGGQPEAKIKYRTIVIFKR